MTLFTHIPHPHIAARQVAGAPTVAGAAAALHGPGPLARVNAALGVRITASVGTMYCAYLFAVIGIMGVVGALTNNVRLVLIVGAVSGYFLQLVLLPIIIVGQNVQAAASDARAQATYDDASPVLAEALKIQEHLATQDGVLTAMHAVVVPAAPPALEV